MSRSKYNNTKLHTCDGIFDSKKEHRRWEELKKLEADGTITGLERQKEFELIPSQRIAGKVIERACKYKADFSYYVDGVFIVEDVKSAITRKKPEYIIKRKLMLYMRGIQIKEV